MAPSRLSESIIRVAYASRLRPANCDLLWLNPLPPRLTPRPLLAPTPRPSRLSESRYTASESPQSASRSPDPSDLPTPPPSDEGPAGRRTDSCIHTHTQYIYIYILFLSIATCERHWRVRRSVCVCVCVCVCERERERERERKETSPVTEQLLRLRIYPCISEYIRASPNISVHLRKLRKSSEQAAQPTRPPRHYPVLKTPSSRPHRHDPIVTTHRHDPIVTTPSSRPHHHDPIITTPSSRPPRHDPWRQPLIRYLLSLSLLSLSRSLSLSLSLPLSLYLSLARSLYQGG